MPDNYYSEVNDHGNVIPIRDLAAVAWADAEKSVKKNQFNYNLWKGITVHNGTAVFENNGVSITATANDCYTDFIEGLYPVEARIPVKTGVTYKLTWKSTETTNYGSAFIFGNGTTTSMASANNTVGKVEYTPPEGVTFVTVRFGVSSNGNTIHYKDIMFTYNDVDVTDYVSYIPDNTELMTWEANAVLGARNIFNFNNRTGSGTITGTTDNFNLSGTGTYRSAEFTMPVEPNTSYKIKFNVEVTSGLCFANAYDVTNSVTLATGIQVTQNTNGYTLEFSTNSTTEIVRVGVFCTGGTSATGDITVKKFEIVLASDTYNDYTPPVMTNKALTDAVSVNGASVTVPENVNVSVIQQNSFYTGAGIKGIEIQFQVTANIASGTAILNVPDGIKPKGFVVLTAIDTNNGTIIPLLLGTGGTITTKLALPAGWYASTVTYR